MKTKVLTGLCLILFVMTGFAAAASERSAGPAGIRQPAPQSARPTATPRAQGNREQMYQEMLAKRTEEHQAAVKELEDIKKLAEEEGATKTAEALQKMIDKKNDEFKQNMDRMNRVRRGRTEQLERTRLPRETTEGAKPEQKEKSGK